MISQTEPVTITRRLLTIEEYNRMGETGILHEDERVELIRGELVQMAAIGSRHAARVGRFTDAFAPRLAGIARVRVQDPIRLPPDTEPEPDVAIAKWRPDYYEGGHPNPEDVLLIIEVSDTTFAYDHGVKLPLYAAAGIPELWIADLKRRRILVCRDPAGAAYRDVTALIEGPLAPLAFPEIVIQVEEMVG